MSNDIGASQANGLSQAEPEEVSALRASIPSAGLYVYAVRVSRRDGNAHTTSHVTGYHMAGGEDEARGIAVAGAMEVKPGMSIDDITILRVNDETIVAVAQAIEARRAGTPKSDPVHESAVLKGCAHD